MDGETEVVEVKRGPGRPKGDGRNVMLGDLHREKIRNSQVLATLIGCAEGRLEISSERLRACEILLRKILPDLSNIELTGADGGPVRFERIEWVVVNGTTNIEHTNGASVRTITGPGEV